MKINFNQIGITYFLNKIDCKSQYGKLALKDLEQLESIDCINDAQKLLLSVIDLESDVKDQARSILSNIKNITMILKNIANRNSVDIVDLHEVKIQAMHTKQLSQLFENKMFDFKAVDEIIAILDPNNENKYSFRIYESYDLELYEIVKKKREIEHAYYNSETSDKSQIMAEREKIVLQEKLKTEEVICKIVNKLASYIDNMIYNVEVLTSCDLTISKSIVYKNYNYCLCEFSDHFEIKSSYLPLVSDSVCKYTPLNVELHEGPTLIVGANMGGKSTILKNIAFNVFLVNHGFLPLAKKFVMPHINNIVFVQSFEDTVHGLSRFGSEVKMLNEALELLDDKTLFLIDEFASSTNPTEGYLFVKSLINYCSSLKTYTILTSHYDNLSTECDTYVVSGIKGDAYNQDCSLSDLMDYDIYKTEQNSIPKQAMLVAEYMDINSDYLEILKKNYKEG